MLFRDVVQMVLGKLTRRVPLFAQFRALLTRGVVTLVHWRGDISARRHPDPIDAVHLIAPRPLLLMHGTNDALVGHAHSELLFARAGEPKRFWLLDKGEHTGLYNLKPDIWEQKVLSFLEEHKL